MPHATKRQQRAAVETARQRAAQARLAQQRAERRRRMLVVVGSSVAVIAVIAVMAVVALTSGDKSKTPSSPGATRAPAAVLDAVTGVSADIIKATGQDGVMAQPKAITGNPLTSGGKPEVLYVGGEFCPYCAGERWALVQALSRFGTFRDLSVIRSAEDNIGTFTFAGSSYTSKYVAFVGRDIEDNARKPLDKLTTAENAIFIKGTGGRGSFPYTNFGGRYETPSGQVDPAMLKDMSAEEIATALGNPNSTIAKAIIGTANGMTAAICATTGDQPANVCTAEIKALRQHFGA